MFRRSWLYVCRVEEIPSSGDWFTKTIDILSVSAIIARGKDGEIRAFHNICSHRGMKLVWDQRGRGGKFSCPYHAWLYDTQGALLNIPDERSEEQTSELHSLMRVSYAVFCLKKKTSLVPNTHTDLSTN